MVKIATLKGRKHTSWGKRPSTFLWLGGLALTCVVFVRWLFQGSDNTGSVGLSPLLSLPVAGNTSIGSYHTSNNTNDNRKVVFEHIPPTKIPVVVEVFEGPNLDQKKTTLQRNDVISNIQMGKMVDWMKSDDWDAAVATHDGQQHFHGFYGLTTDGIPAWIPQPYVHYNSESGRDKAQHHQGFSFNKWRSDQLPLSLPRIDQRSAECLALSKSYQKKKLPNTSVVFVAYNEPFSTLFRSIHSVLDRTPPELLHEIILVDDGSEIDAWGEELENYIALLPKTKLFRLPRRKGLMAARVYGAEMATGDTLTFLDSHIEAMPGWLPPLLERIAVDRRYVTVPVIDSINADTWEYTLGGISILGFSWTLGQVGISRKPPENKTDPMPSPVMAGGLFTIDRRWFFELGAYDPELQFWGGEEMEISFKIWQCGGRLECIPCSGVGHVFRSSNHWKGSVYPVPMNAIRRNRIRAAAVWMDPEHFQLFSSLTPGYSNIGDLSRMKAIKEKLQCKSFKWYLDTTYPELFFPSSENILWKGQVRHTSSGKCLDTMGKAKQGSPIGMFPCHGGGGAQLFVRTKLQEIRIPDANWDFCLDANGGGEHKEAIAYMCHGGQGAQLWTYDQYAKKFTSLNLCLTYQSGSHAFMEKCKLGNPDQSWEFIDQVEQTVQYKVEKPEENPMAKFAQLFPNINQQQPVEEDPMVKLAMFAPPNSNQQQQKMEIAEENPMAKFARLFPKNINQQQPAEEDPKVKFGMFIPPNSDQQQKEVEKIEENPFLKLSPNVTFP